jgi:hypothetical protein
MSPKKHPNTVRHGGPGASHEDAKEPVETAKKSHAYEGKKKHRQVQPSKKNNR